MIVEIPPELPTRGKRVKASMEAFLPKEFASLGKMCVKEFFWEISGDVYSLVESDDIK